MKHIKRVLTIFLIFLIMAASSVPSLRCSHFVYADSSTDQWTTVTTNEELSEAFRYYCKSRNLVVDGSVLDALTSFTTNSFNTICNTLGIDVTALQAHLKRSTDSNGKVQFLFDHFGVTAYNRIFAEFLQNNDLEVGDEVNDKNIYTGYYNDGVGVFSIINGSNVEYYGSYFVYSSDYLKNYFTSTDVGNLSLNFPQIFGVTLSNYVLQKQYNDIDTVRVVKSSAVKGVVRNNGRNTFGYPSLIYNKSDGKFYVGFVMRVSPYTSSPEYYYTWAQINGNDSIQPVNIFIYSTTINNNTYNDNSQTVINNDGDVYNYDYDDDDPPVNPPSGGGGDDPPTDPDDWGIDLPDLNIDWLLTGKENKFPFNIPFNIILTLSLLNAEPEAPHFEGTIDLGVYQWNYDIDLEQFDPVAEICRNFEFIAFLIGLMLLTKRLIWG